MEIINKIANQKTLILLFGGSGKLGSFIIKNLDFNKDLYDLFILDKVSLESNKAVDNKFIECNANNINDLEKNFSKLKKISTKCIVINLIGYDFPVNNKEYKFTSPVDINEDQLRSTLQINLETSHKIVQSIIKENFEANIVFLSSVYASKPTNSNLYTNDEDLFKRYKPYIYGASKAALEKLAKDLSVYLPNIKSRINVISLGGVELGLTDVFIKNYSSWSPQKKMISPSSFLNVLKWLIFESPMELNGCIINLDSGLSNI